MATEAARRDDKQRVRARAPLLSPRSRAKRRFFICALSRSCVLSCAAANRVTVAVTAKTQGLSGRTTEAPAAATSGPTTGHSLPVDVSDADVTGSMRPPEGPQSPAPSSEASAAISAAEVWRNCETQESDDDELSEVDEAEDLTRVEEFDEADQVEEIHLT